MSIFKTLREKPWDAQVAAAGNAVAVAPIDPQGAARIALRFIMAIVSVLFLLFIII